MDEERGPVKALHLEADGMEQKTKKKWKELLEWDMMARGLQRFYTQNRETWRLGSKNRRTPASGEICVVPAIKVYTPGAK